MPPELAVTYDHNRMVFSQFGPYREGAMKSSFPGTVPSKDKLDSLFKVVDTTDVVAILISADPDAMASAMALKRLFWRKVKRVDLA